MHLQMQQRVYTVSWKVRDDACWILDKSLNIAKILRYFSCIQYLVPPDKFYCYNNQCNQKQHDGYPVDTMHIFYKI